MLKKGIKNLIASFLNQILTIALGIIIPRLVLVSLGSEANGLLNSVSQVLVYLSLLEAGIGTATSQALYAPVRRRDEQDINAILAATDKFYRKTGTLYFLGILLMAGIYPFIVKTDISKTTIIIVILLSGMSSVINYFFQGKYKILLQTEGKGYLLINLGTIINTAISIGKIILLLHGYGIIALQLLYFLLNTAQMIFVMVYIKKNYKWLNLSVKPNIKALTQKNAVLIHQITGMIFNNTDMVILSAFEGLKTVSVYSMYNMVYGMIKTAISNVVLSITFAFGQIYNTDKKKYIELHDVFEVYYLAFIMGLYCVAYVMILPFLKLYTSGVVDVNYLDGTLATLFIIIFILSNGRVTSGMVIEYAGHYEKTKWRSVIEAVINVVVSIIGVYYWGIYGVLIGTIAALIYRTNDMIIYASKKLLQRTPFITYRRWGTDIFVFVLLAYIGRKVVGNTVSNYFTLLLYAVPVFVAVMAVFVIINSLCDMECCIYVLRFIKRKKIT